MTYKIPLSLGSAIKLIKIDISNELGLSVSMVSAIENDKKSLSYEKLTKLIDYLNRNRYYHDYDLIELSVKDRRYLNIEGFSNSQLRLLKAIMNPDKLDHLIKSLNEFND